jgi:hypothetical protein
VAAANPVALFTSRSAKIIKFHTCRNTEFLHESAGHGGPGVNVVQLLAGKSRFDTLGNSEGRRYREHANSDGTGMIQIAFVLKRFLALRSGESLSWAF